MCANKIQKIEDNFINKKINCFYNEVKKSWETSGQKIKCKCGTLIKDVGLTNNKISVEDRIGAEIK